MALNPYFSQGSKSERWLFEDLIIEAIKIYGHDVYYIPRKIVSEDLVLNEEVISRFDDAFLVEMYMDSIDSFEGDGKFISKFGLEFRDSIGLVLARRRWNQLIGRFGYLENTAVPKEGDLIYFPMMKTLFEIKYTDTEKVFYQLKNLPTFRLTCEAFEYRNQQFNTGISAIDNLEAKLANTIRIVVEGDLTAAKLLQLNEAVTFELPSGVTGTSEILSNVLNADEDELLISLAPPTFDDGLFHEIIANTEITGTVSEQTITVGRVIELDDAELDTFENDSSAENADFETVGNSYIDFTEHNPFGEPNDA
jgi:hypothetical protein